MHFQREGQLLLAFRLCWLSLHHGTQLSELGHQSAVVTSQRNEVSFMSVALELAPQDNGSKLQVADELFVLVTVCRGNLPSNKLP